MGPVCKYLRYGIFNKKTVRLKNCVTYPHSLET